MKYFKTTQFVPGKGEARMYYECSDELEVIRTANHIPGTDEVDVNDDPVVKKLVFPERLTESTAEEFESIWERGGADS